MTTRSPFLSLGLAWAARSETLDLFEKDGFKVFGGGRNIDEAKKVLVVEDHGNKLAFLGMNSFGPKSVWATADRPGAQQYDKDILHKELADARKEADADKRDADYKVAVEKCDALAGGAKDSCIGNAKTHFGKS